MSRQPYASLNPSKPNDARDSLELASLASSTPSSSRVSGESSISGIGSSRKVSLSHDDPLHSEPTPRGTPHSRSYSVSSAFDFAANFFPLSTTAGGYSALGAPASGPLDLNNATLEKYKSLTYLNGLSLIVGSIIGSGIFSSPSQVYTNAGSPGASLIVWGVAGILAWTGAASYAELGGAIPLNGGAQVYLSKIFGELVGFLFTWSAVFVLKPGSAAVIAIIFGEYIVRAIVGAEVLDISPWINKGVAIIGLAVVTLINCTSTKLATRTGDMLMFLKFVAMIAITIIGIIVAATGMSYGDAIWEEWKKSNWFDGTSSDPSSWAVALYAGLWAFDGWDNTNYVTGEFRDPAKSLPRVIHTAMPLVIISYIMVNLAYIFVLPKIAISSSNTIAVDFGHLVFGPKGSLVLALIVGASCFGALNASTFTSGRLVYAAGKEGFLPEILGHIGMPGSDPSEITTPRLRQGRWDRRRLLRFIADDNGSLLFTPINALIFNALLAVVYIVIGSFATLVTFYGVAGYTFYFLTVLGLIVLRVREPTLERPYKCWIGTPIIFCCVSLFLLSRAIVRRPLQTVIVVVFIAAGIPVWYWRVRKSGRGKAMENGGGFWRRWGRAPV